MFFNWWLPNKPKLRYNISVIKTLKGNEIQVQIFPTQNWDTTQVWLKGVTKSKFKSPHPNYQYIQK